VKARGHSRASHSEAATGRRERQLNAIDGNYFAGVWPVIGVRDEPGTNGIVTDVVPFLSVTLVAPQDVIEKTALPSGISRRPALNCFCQHLFEQANPPPQFKSVRAGDEKMEMIWHDHIAPDGDVMIGIRSVCETNQALTDRGTRKQFSAAVRADCHEINRIIGKDALNARWNPGVTAHPVAAALWAAQG
jgi:hypothetical protein